MAWDPGLMYFLCFVVSPVTPSPCMCFVFVARGFTCHPQPAVADYSDQEQPI